MLATCHASLFQSWLPRRQQTQTALNRGIDAEFRRLKAQRDGA
jgi:hypothetical protein